MLRRCRSLRALKSRVGYLNSWRRSTRSRILFLFLSTLQSTAERYAASLCQVLGENYSEVISLSSLSSLRRKSPLIVRRRPGRQTPGGNRLRPDHPQTVGSISTGQSSSAQLVNRRSRPLVSSGRTMLLHPLRILVEVARPGR